MTQEGGLAGGNNPSTPAEDRPWCDWGPDPLLRAYHDQEYGVTPQTDAGFLEMLVLELNQAGLSWLTILKKREAFRSAFRGFDIDAVASFGEEDRQRLLADPSIIRNRRKIDAAIENAREFQRLRDEYGSIKRWLDSHAGKSREEWVKLFKSHFTFTGPEITGEFLLSTGYLHFAHQPRCWRSTEVG